MFFVIFTVSGIKCVGFLFFVSLVLFEHLLSFYTFYSYFFTKFNNLYFFIHFILTIIRTINTSYYTQYKYISTINICLKRDERTQPKTSLFVLEKHRCPLQALGFNDVEPNEIKFGSKFKTHLPCPIN